MRFCQATRLQYLNAHFPKYELTSYQLPEVAAGGECSQQASLSSAATCAEPRAESPRVVACQRYFAQQLQSMAAFLMPCVLVSAVSLVAQPSPSAAGGAAVTSGLRAATR